jgi:hypothetical protein
MDEQVRRRLKTCPCSQTGQCLCRDSPTGEWRRCEHWKVDLLRARKEGRARPWE